MSQLRAIDADIEQALEQINVPAYVIDKHGIIRWINPAARRVVVEPDVRNTAVHALNEAVGFVPDGPVVKPEKEALLSFCTRDQFEAATGLTTVASGASI